MRTLKFVLGALCILVLPLMAEVTNMEGFDWDATDYIVASILLAAFGASIAFATGARTTAQRIVGIGFVLFVLAMYVHLAVGIVDTWPLAGS